MRFDDENCILDLYRVLVYPKNYKMLVADNDA